jgi:glutathione-regulated potassium-efflux system ancillary protein KefF
MATSPSLVPAFDAVPATGAEVLVIVAHPQIEQSRANRRLMEAAAAVRPSAAGSTIEVRDLYALYPDY